MQTRKTTIALMSAALMMAAGGCQKAAPIDSQVAHTPIPTTAAVIDAGALIAAGEPFEVLTEESQSADVKRLHELVRTADEAYRSVRPQLPIETQKAIDAQTSALRAAVGKQDRLAAALSSVEIYRALLEGQAPVPTATVRAGLLDYSGFRYQALANAPLANWAAMQQSVNFAQDQWLRLSPEISSPDLRTSFKQSLIRMANAIARKDAAAARSAATHELNLVDELEKNVAGKKGARG